MSKKIFEEGILHAQLLAQSSNIHLDPPRMEEKYATLALHQSHGVAMDFYIRQRGVGASIFEPDHLLFYMIQEQLRSGALTIDAAGKPPHLTGDFQLTPDQPSNYFIVKIGSQDLRDRPGFEPVRDPVAYSERAKQLAFLLYREWIVKLMPIVEDYKRYRQAGVLRTMQKSSAIPTTLPAEHSVPAP